MSHTRPTSTCGRLAGSRQNGRQHRMNETEQRGLQCSYVARRHTSEMGNLKSIQVGSCQPAQLQHCHACGTTAELADIGGRAGAAWPQQRSMYMVLPFGKPRISRARHSRVQICPEHSRVEYPQWTSSSTFLHRQLA